MTGVRDFNLGGTKTYSDRPGVWVPGGSTPWEGFLTLTVCGPGAKVETTTYAVGLDTDGGRVQLRAIQPGRIPERIARMRSDREARCYWVTIRGNRLTCNCRAKDECKHTDSVARLIDMGVLRCRTTVSLGGTTASGSG